MLTKFDNAIKDAVDKYLPGVDWRLYKAQLMAESALAPYAVSPAGAEGIAQFMPKTWQDMIKQLKFPKSAKATDIKYAIPAGAHYMAGLLKTWSSPRPEMDRYCLALASYNAGAGNVIKAQKAVGGLFLYSEIIKGLPAVTGSNAAETIAYVKRILYYFNQQLTG